MGVKGFSTLIDENKKTFLTDHKLHDTKVIIDGSNLYHFLYYHYKISHQFGGDYDHYARKCKRFFNMLKVCNVEPYVLFDGGYDPNDRKLGTVLDRMNDRRKKVSLICAKGRGCVLPVLAYETFRQVLVELKIPHVACVYEADREIAVLAKRWNCPVLSNDSDFFVYQLSGGFIPLDYINLTLCVCHTKTGKACILGRNGKPAENEFIYIPVMFYNCQRFITQFNENCAEFVLPLFATVMGNDYVEFSVLYGFYSQLQVSKNPSKKSFKVKAQGRQQSILYWLDYVKSEDDAIQQVLATVAMKKRDSVKEILLNSINDYKNIDNFALFDVEEFLTGYDTVSDDQLCSTSDKLLPHLRDYYDNKLPFWFGAKLRSCEINGSFLQNASVVHRIMFNCQIEILREPSTYACSRDIRACIYGIIFGTADLSNELNRHNCVEEYDRYGINTKKFYVKPVRSLPNISHFPSIGDISSLLVEDRKNILYAALGMPLSNVMPEYLQDDSSAVLALTMNVWIRNAQPKVSENHLNSLIMCIIILHIKALDWVNMKKSQGLIPLVPDLYSDIVTAYESMEEDKVTFLMKRMEKYFVRPDQSKKNPRQNKIIHGFSQYQCCYVDTLYLNQVLKLPVCIPSPSVILNNTFVYNLCCDLDIRPHADLYLADMLTRGSTLLKVFTGLKNVVVSLCNNDKFEFDKQIKVIGQGQSKVKSKNKPKGKKKKAAEVATEQSDNDNSKSDDSSEVKPISFANCDVSNKFALLDLSD